MTSSLKAFRSELLPLCYSAIYLIPSSNSCAGYRVGWRRAVKNAAALVVFQCFFNVAFNVRGLFQEEDADEDTLTTDTLSPNASHSPNSCSTQVSAATTGLHLTLLFRDIPNIPSWNVHMQVEALLQEVQQLREELRSRDQTISQLNRQLVRSLKSPRPLGVSQAFAPSCQELKFLPASKQTDAAAATRCRCLETKTGVEHRPTQTSLVGSESAASQTHWKEQAVSSTHTQGMHFTFAPPCDTLK